MRIQFDLNKAKRLGLLVNREQIMSEHSMSDKYRMDNKFPLLVNIEGHYIKANDILDLCVEGCKKMAVCHWLLELKFPNNNSWKTIEFEWRR